LNYFLHHIFFIKVPWQKIYVNPFKLQYRKCIWNKELPKFNSVKIITN